MPELRVLPGNAGGGMFVCPWCGANFPRRHREIGYPSLEGHWRTNPTCSANRGVNNPTQSKFDVRDSRIPELRLPDTEDRDA